MAVLHSETDNPLDSGHRRFMQRVWTVEQELRKDGYTLGYRFEEPSDQGVWDPDVFREFSSYWMVGEAKNKRVQKKFGYSHVPRRTADGDATENVKKTLRHNRNLRKSPYAADRAWFSAQKALKALD